MKILIVEDSKEAIKFLEKHLTDHQLFVAESEVEALQILQKESSFDLVICDHNFPLRKGGRPEPLGPDILYVLISEHNYKGHFLHFSADPCPQKYELQDQVKFRSRNKDHYIYGSSFEFDAMIKDIAEELASDTNES